LDTDEPKDDDAQKEADKLAAEKEKADIEAKKLADSKKDGKDDLIDVDDDSDDDEDPVKKAAAEKAKLDAEAASTTQAEQLKGWTEYFEENTILSKEDLEGFDGTEEALVEAFKINTHENCRFDQIKVEDLEEAVNFYKNFNKLMSESGSILWKTFLMTGAGGLLVILWLGFVSKIKQ